MSAPISGVPTDTHSPVSPVSDLRVKVSIVEAATTGVPRGSARPWLRLPQLDPVLLAGWCLLLFFYGIHAGELWRTEALRAIIARDMLMSGDWLTPRLYGEPFLTKPSGFYLAIVLCSLPFGQVTEWSARLPSALAASASILLFYWFFRRHLGRVGGLAAACILPMAPMWVDKASAAEIDMLHTFWILAAILCFFRAAEPEDKLSFAWTLVSFTCLAFGTLTKWSSPQFFYCTAIPYLWYRGRLRWLWSGPHLAGLALMLGIVGGWACWLASRVSWETLWNTFYFEAAIRFAPSTVEAHRRPYPWHETLLHPLVILANTLPWSPLALLTLTGSFWQSQSLSHKRLVMGLHCWAWPNLLFWSLPMEHTPRHSWPMFAAIAGLAAVAWVAWHEGRLLAHWRRVTAVRVLMAWVVLWVGFKCVFVEAVVPPRNRDRHPREKGELIASLVPIQEILYVFFLKDEGILFYFGRPAVRVRSPQELPAGESPHYAILTQHEFDTWQGSQRIEPVRAMHDEQGAPIVLARVSER